MNPSYALVQAGDSAIVVEFEDRIDPRINARAVALAETLVMRRVAGVRDVVPTIRSVTVYFDPLRTDRTALEEQINRAAMESVGVIGKDHAADAAGTPEPTHIPVCYGGDLGPDLEAVAAFGRMSEADVVSLHTGRTYRVFMLGFVPGFAYLGNVDERIASPRLTTPRTRVPAGSVAIAGMQTGIYPMETPGGWRLIGRTNVKPFDLASPKPFLFKAGDLVRFYPIDRDDYDADGRRRQTI